MDPRKDEKRPNLLTGIEGIFILYLVRFNRFGTDAESKREGGKKYADL
jgi:hypothetical protein